MPERAGLYEITQIGPETIPGTAVSATKRLIGTSLRMAPKGEVKTYRAKGSRVGAVGVMNKEWSEGPVEQDPALYSGELSYLLAGLLGPPSITNPSSGVYLHEWDPSTFTGLNPKTFTTETGSWVRAAKFPYVLVKSLEMKGTRDGVTLSGSAIGQEMTDGITLTAGTAEVQTQTKNSTVSGGTFTLSFMGEVTSAIAYNASNATVLAALEALPNIAPGDVALASGPVNSGGVTFTFAGQYASENVPLIVVDSTNLTGGGSYTIAQTTAGATLSTMVQQPISGKDWDFYVDTAAASLGSTKYTRCFEWGWSISDMYQVIWPGNTSEPSWAVHVDVAPTTQVTFKLEADSTGMGQWTNLKAGTKIFPRIKCTGPTLGASTYLAQFDFSVLLTDISEPDEDDTVDVTFTGEMQYDRTWGQWASIDVRNETTSIA